VEVHKVIEELFKILSGKKDLLHYIGPEIQDERFEFNGQMNVYGELSGEKEVQCFSYLDSSSRSLSFIDLRLFLGSLYMNDCGSHLPIPVKTPSPFLALKASLEVMDEVRKVLGDFVLTENPNGEPYDSEYKDDNISDELRLRLENTAISMARAPLIITDGPIIPGVLLKSLPEKYGKAYERLIEERKPFLDKMAGIVKRLEMSWKLYRLQEIQEEVKKVLGRQLKAPDPVILEAIAGDKDYSTPIIEEVINGVKRYMVYVKVRNSCFRVESQKLENLLIAYSVTKANLSSRGIPYFIEIGDRIAKRLSASIYIIAYILGSPKLNVSYDEPGKFRSVTRELEETH
jgi:hypothetical protein